MGLEFAICPGPCCRHLRGITDGVIIDVMMGFVGIVGASWIYGQYQGYRIVGGCERTWLMGLGTMDFGWDRVDFLQYLCGENRSSTIDFL